MRASALRQSALAVALFAAASCDSHSITTGPAAARITVALPASFVAQDNGLAAQTTTDRRNDDGVATLRVRISVAGESRTLLDVTRDPDVVCPNNSTSTSDTACEFPVQFPLPDGAASATFELLVDALNASGVVLFEAGPTEFSLGSDGRSASVTAQAEYVGPGNDATGVQISPRSVTVAATASVPITCVATRAGSATGIAVPLAVSSSNPGVADVGFTTTGIQVFGIAAGTAQIRCELDFGSHASDVVTVTVTGAPGSQTLQLVSGGGQSGTAGGALSTPITVRLVNGAGQPVGSAPITVTPASGSGSVLPSSGSTDAVGAFTTIWTLGSTVGTQSLVFSSPGVTPLTVTATAAAGPTTGSISGTVRDANTAAPVAGATLELRSGSGNVSGSILATATSAQTTGAFTFTALAPGTYTVRATRPGYADQSQNAVVTSGQATTVSFAISQTTACPVVCIALSWGLNPPDLDAHLITPSGAEISFEDFGSCTSAPFACLDADTQTGIGPETIRISQLQAGTYMFKVHDFYDDVDLGNKNGTGLAQSGAIVTVTIANTVRQVFTVPNQPGIYWSVFNLNGSTQAITTVNTISNVGPFGLPPFPGAGLKAGKVPPQR